MSWVSDFFNKAKDYGKTAWGLGKRVAHGINYGLGKVHRVATTVNRVLNNKDIKNVVKAVGAYVPEVNDAYKTVKKYSNMAGNYSKLGQQKVNDVKSRATSMISRAEQLSNAIKNEYDRPYEKKHSIERTRPSSQKDFLGSDYAFGVEGDVSSSQF